MSFLQSDNLGLDYMMEPAVTTADAIELAMRECHSGRILGCEDRASLGSEIVAALDLNLFLAWWTYEFIIPIPSHQQKPQMGSWQ